MFAQTTPSSLAGFDRQILEASPDVIFGLSTDLRLNYLNPAWFAFAAENNGEPAISTRFCLGVRIIDAIAKPLKRFYTNAYRRALKTGQTWRHDYECSSGDTFRRFHQSVYRLRDGKGLIVINSLVEESPHDPVKRPPHDPDKNIYVKKNGLIHQCCHCRRVQRAHSEDTWDWVPQWVNHLPPNMSHGLCPTCFSYYYGGKATTR